LTFVFIIFDGVHLEEKAVQSNFINAAKSCFTYNTEAH